MNVNGYLIEAHAADLIKARVSSAAADHLATAARRSGTEKSAKPVRPPRVRWFRRSPSAGLVLTPRVDS